MARSSRARAATALGGACALARAEQGNPRTCAARNGTEGGQRAASESPEPFTRLIRSRSAVEGGESRRRRAVAVPPASAAAGKQQSGGPPLASLEVPKVRASRASNLAERSAPPVHPCTGAPRAPLGNAAPRLRVVSHAERVCAPRPPLRHTLPTQAEVTERERRPCHAPRPPNERRPRLPRAVGRARPARPRRRARGPSRVDRRVDRRVESPSVESLREGAAPSRKRGPRREIVCEIVRGASSKPG